MLLLAANSATYVSCASFRHADIVVQALQAVAELYLSPYGGRNGGRKTGRVPLRFIGGRIVLSLLSHRTTPSPALAVSEMTFVIILLSIVFARVFAKDCYNLDGSVAVDHLPCVGNAVNTHCCPQGSTCLTNGLCLL